MGLTDGSGLQPLSVFWGVFLGRCPRLVWGWAFGLAPGAAGWCVCRRLFGPVPGAAEWCVCRRLFGPMCRASGPVPVASALRPRRGRP